MVRNKKSKSQIINAILKLDPGLKSEAHVVAELYHHLRLLNFKSNELRVEHSYPNDSNMKCDLFINIDQGYWLEVKVYLKCESSNTRSKKHNPTAQAKTIQNASSIDHALTKLNGISSGIPLIFIYQDIDYNPTKHPWEDIENRCKSQNIYMIRYKAHTNELYTIDDK